MALHDYVCKSCEAMFPNELIKPVCECGGEVEITFRNWKGFNFQRDYCSKNQTHTTTGERRRFDASDDPVCMSEIGLLPDHGMKTFSEEQSQHYAGKMLRDGDSPSLRREILRERKKNEVSMGATDGPEVM